MAHQISGRGAKAALFLRELLEACESLEGISDQYGQRTLADLMYLQGAILTGERMEVWPGETRVGDVLGKLPSSETWMKYTELGGIWAHACERVTDEDAKETEHGNAEPAGSEGGVTCYSGYLTHKGVRVQVDFEATGDADQGKLDAAFLKALGEQVELDYLAIGTR